MSNVIDNVVSNDVKVDSEGKANVVVRRKYVGKPSSETAERVWQVVSDFAGIKAIFPSLLSIYITYPDSSSTTVGMVRHMNFAPSDTEKPLSAANPLASGVETLVELDPRARRLRYVAALGFPVSNYASTMEVIEGDSCSLVWISTFDVAAGDEAIAQVIANVLVSGANQIATTLRLD
jgi:hypothetical protein